ncbi:MAG: sugar phosphate nucleotidyltransferase [Bacteroidales bacterium]
MILAAGLGTRLRPLTDRCPKALLKWEGKPLLEHVLLKLKSEGFSEAVINIHHHAQMIRNFVEENKSFGMDIHFSQEEELLDTGGGIARASAHLQGEPFLVYNVDVMCTIRLQEMFDDHVASGAMVTLAVKDRRTSRSLLVNGDGLLKGWRDNRSGETILTGNPGEELHPIAYSAIMIMDPAVFGHMPREEVFPVMPFLLALSRTEKVNTYRHDADVWRDMGRLSAFDPRIAHEG